MARKSSKSVKVTISMPKFILEGIDELAQEVEISRSEVISNILQEVISNDSLLDKIYPLEEEKEET